jgi:hypothetical protein
MSSVCLQTPPGDTPKRRGLIDAWMMGCIPVVFDERSRNIPLFLTPFEASYMSVLLPADDLLEGGTATLTAHLEAIAEADLQRMRAAALVKVTSLHWAYSDLGEDDHEQVGPDAWDSVLYYLMQRKARVS